ncbi:MAG TPA: RcnB family protein [Rhizomicrobium sp.]|jgi:Ni/Co efflux regulator RcnB|nr:RcnB family protein [Rhizomicrobium sp.]
MKKTLSFALALTLLAGTGSAFAQGYDNRDRNAPPVTNQQRPDDRNMSDHNQGNTQQRSDDHDRNNDRDMSMRGPRHPDWRQGGHIARDDWGRGVHVDYRAHHLRRPPRGYEWRQVDGNFVLAAAATGLIASIILNAH